MGNFSFSNLSLGFAMYLPTNTFWSANETTTSTVYSFITNAGHDWDLEGQNITYGATFPTGGTITGGRLDLGNNDPNTAELIFTGISVDITDFQIGVGTAQDQNNNFWKALLSGDDTFDFAGMADNGSTREFAGDGASHVVNQVYFAGNDIFTSGSTVFSVTLPIITGDISGVSAGTVIGGDDFFDLSAWRYLGDFGSLNAGASVVGGDDVFLPRAVGGSLLHLSGDGLTASGFVVGGDDLIDLSNTDFSAFTGGDGSVTIHGDLFGISGSGVLIGGDDTIYGSALGDKIWGEVGSGGAGFIAEQGNDLIYGLNGDDTISGDTGDDTISGGEGEDSLDGGADNDRVEGDAGNDRVSGADGDDTLNGDAGFDRLNGGAGDDVLNGGAGNDTLRGAVGEDRLNGDDGVDVIFGGGGGDVAYGGNGADRIRPEAGNDTVNGGADDDRIFGGVGFDVLNGDAGNDLLDGNGGNDTLSGSFGFDTLIGNFGSDRLDGGGGNDTLQGSSGNDTVTGGGGNDTFVFALGDDNDVYTDFTAGAGMGDVIELSGFGASFDTFSEVLAAASQAGANVVINFGGGDTITLLNTTLANLHQDDFIFS